MAAADIHLSSSYLAAFNETLKTEELVSKPMELMVLKTVGGFAERV
jgi:hypothetical protein